MVALCSGETQEVKVTFSPDQQSEHFHDRCHIQLFGQVSHVYLIIGFYSATS